MPFCLPHPHLLVNIHLAGDDITDWASIEAKRAAEDAEDEKRRAERQEQRRIEDEKRLMEQRQKEMFFDNQESDPDNVNGLVSHTKTVSQLIGVLPAHWAHVYHRIGSPMVQHPTSLQPTPPSRASNSVTRPENGSSSTSQPGAVVKQPIIYPKASVYTKLPVLSLIALSRLPLYSQRVQRAQSLTLVAAQHSVHYR